METGGQGGTCRVNGTAIVYQVPWTGFDVLATGTAVLAENGPVMQSKMETQIQPTFIKPLLCAGNCTGRLRVCFLV